MKTRVNEIRQMIKSNENLYLTKSIYGFGYCIKKKTDSGFIKIVDIPEFLALQFVDDSKKEILGTDVIYKLN